jgi:prolyl-tRNA synthetase
MTTKIAKSSESANVTFHSTKDNFSEWYEELMVTAQIVDKHWDIKGMPIFLPYGYYMHNTIMKLLEEGYQKLGIKMYQFPAFIPRTFLEQEKDHVKGFESQCFWHENQMCLRPTSETAMYSMFSKWVKTEADLPLLVQQSCNVFRYETKGTKPLIRVREIPWNEAHTAHSTPEEAQKLLEDAWILLFNILTDILSVSGLRLRRPEWDKFPGADYTDVLDVIMPCGRVLQTVGSHYLGQHFSKPFNIIFSKGEENENAFMTCIGVSTRALASVLSIHGDDKGLVLPSVLAPYQVIVVPIYNKTTEEAMKNKTNEIKAQLEQAGIRVQIDNDGTKRPGEKYYLYEMKGVPIRIDIGPKDLEKNQFVLVIRAVEGKQFVPLDQLVPKVKEALELFDRSLKERAKSSHDRKVTDCSTIDEIKEVLSHGGFAKVPFFTMDRDGTEDAENIRTQTGGEIRGWCPTEVQPPEGTKCIISNNPARYYAYVARAY